MNWNDDWFLQWPAHQLETDPLIPLAFSKMTVLTHTTSSKIEVHEIMVWFNTTLFTEKTLYNLQKKSWQTVPQTFTPRTLQKIHKLLLVNFENPAKKTFPQKSLRDELISPNFDKRSADASAVDFNFWEFQLYLLKDTPSYKTNRQKITKQSPYVLSRAC